MKLCTFSNDKLGISNAGEIKVVRCHRLGRPPHLISESMNRPKTIIVRFLLYSDRDTVWKASWGLRDKVHYVKEDFPDKVKENRKVLLPVLRLTRNAQL